MQLSKHRKFTQSINFPIVLRVVGWLLMIEAMFMAAPAVVALIYGETMIAIEFAISIAITLITGLAMNRIRPLNKSMRKREGLLLTATVWVFFSIFGMLPFLFSGTVTGVTDGFFETMSGFTTTGASVIRDVENLPRGILFWRSMMQWIGGMGIILFTLAVLPMLNYKGGVSLFNSEVTGITHERMRPRVSQTAKSLWGMYLVFTALLTTLLILGPMDWYDALCHTMSTVSTGGFSTKNNGLHYWHDYYTDGMIMLFMLLCGINFTIIYNVAVRGRFSEFKRSDTLKWYLSIIALGGVVVFARIMYMGFVDEWQFAAVLAWFDTISAITSTGFATYDYEQEGQFIFFFLIVLMFFGGMAGSTAGGAKIDRFVVLLKNVKNEMYKVVHSNAVTSVRLDGKSVPHMIVEKVLAFLSVYVVVMVAVAVVLTLYGMPAFDALFNSLSAISNIGFGYGEMTNGIDKFAMIHPVAKWLLAFEMLVGRLEVFTVLALFSPGFWKKD
jgi:trk system potassium uptake protein TrkH